MTEEINFKIKALTKNDKELWGKVVLFAKNCSWQTTGDYLSNRIKNDEFFDWERVFVALSNNIVIGYCALTKTSTVFDNLYSPYISYIFVDEKYRGNKISRMMCMAAINYSKKIGFSEVYLYSELVNFYEKIGFIKIDEKEAPWGIKQSIYKYIIK